MLRLGTNPGGEQFMAMGMPGLGGGKGEPPQTFGSLTIERRVLLTPSRTISIPNISTIATRTIYELNAKALVTLGLVLLSSGGLISLLTSSWGLALVGIAIVLFIAAASSGSSTNFLIITTNDGTRSLFSGPREETLEQVRRLLSDKINAHDETATYNINFETGTIESLNVAAIAKLETAAVVNGSNNQVVANSPEARIGTKNTILTAINSPGAQLGRGIVANGNANTVQKTHIITRPCCRRSSRCSASTHRTPMPAPSRNGWPSWSCSCVLARPPPKAAAACAISPAI